MKFPLHLSRRPAPAASSSLTRPGQGSPLPAGPALREPRDGGTKPGVGASASSRAGVRQRVFLALRDGATVASAAAAAGVPLSLAEIIVDDMQRSGLLEQAKSFCSSGLGACEGGTSTEAQIHCAACPLVGLKKVA